jgi:hypothetical protein
MKNFPLLLLALFLASCAHDAPPVAEPGSGSGLVGRWKLISHQCFCTPTPTADEIISFTAKGFTVYRNTRLASTGTYADTLGTLCGGGTPVPVLRFTYATPRQQPASAAATVHADTLTLDYGGACDAALDTYQRLP